MGDNYNLPRGATSEDIYELVDTLPMPGSIFSRTIKLMLERQKSSIYQHVMLFECAKIIPYQQDMSH